MVNGLSLTIFANVHQTLSDIYKCQLSSKKLKDESFQPAQTISDIYKCQLSSKKVERLESFQLTCFWAHAIVHQLLNDMCTKL